VNLPETGRYLLNDSREGKHLGAKYKIFRRWVSFRLSDLSGTLNFLASI
jgi:hypothetical protein